MSEYEDLERDENGVTYFEVVNPKQPDVPLLLIASRFQFDNYRLTKSQPAWKEVPSLVDYFIGEGAPDAVYHLTFEQAREIAEGWGGKLITEAELNPAGRPRQEARKAGRSGVS
jgi:hypothetical protein